MPFTVSMQYAIFVILLFKKTMLCSGPEDNISIQQVFLHQKFKTYKHISIPFITSTWKILILCTFSDELIENAGRVI